MHFFNNEGSTWNLTTKPFFFTAEEEVTSDSSTCGKILIFLSWVLVLLTMPFSLLVCFKVSEIFHFLYTSLSSVFIHDPANFHIISFEIFLYWILNNTSCFFLSCLTQLLLWQQRSHIYIITGGAGVWTCRHISTWKIDARWRQRTG